MSIPKNCFLQQIFDPGSEFIGHWNKLMFVVGSINFYLDPFFFYLLKHDHRYPSRNVDLRVGALLVTLRTVGDFFLVLGIIVKLRTAFEDPGSKVFKRRRLVQEPRAIAIKYCKSTFLVDLVAILPLPQVCLYHQIIATKIALTGSSEHAIKVYFRIYVLFCFQLIPRFFVVIRSQREITNTAGILIKSAMSGALYNLFWFVNICNVAGAMYYFLHVTWLLKCTRIVVQKELDPRTLEWEQLLSNCTENNEIEQGMFASVLKNKIVTRNFIQRYMFCFSWGLKSLSSLAQNFTTSHSSVESIVSIFVTLFGLLCFADLITRMQGGIQSMEEREEQQRARQREVKEWMDYHQLPLHLKVPVDHAIQSEWTESGIDDDAMLDSLPMDLRSEIRKYLYINSICKLPKFANMETPLVEAICQHLKTFSGKESTYIVYEGDIVKQMLFIFSGQLELSFSDRGNSSSTILGPGECCGQELVTWASQPTISMDNLPPSTWTIKCLTDVEAFLLHAYDMKILTTQFAHNQEFRRAFKQHYP